MAPAGHAKLDRHDPEPLTREERERYRAAASLLREWIREDDGYDDEIWPAIEEELRRGGLRSRPPRA